MVDDLIAWSRTRPAALGFSRGHAAELVAVADVTRRVGCVEKQVNSRVRDQSTASASARSSWLMCTKPWVELPWSDMSRQSRTRPAALGVEKAVYTFS
jgi:hypothetical protein